MRGALVVCYALSCILLYVSMIMGEQAIGLISLLMCITIAILSLENDEKILIIMITAIYMALAFAPAWIVNTETECTNFERSNVGLLYWLTCKWPSPGI